MNEKPKEIIGLLLMIVMFIFIGLAVCVNIQDELTDSNYAYWFNIVGFCLVPIAIIGSYICYKHMLKNSEGVV